MALVISYSSLGKVLEYHTVFSGVTKNGQWNVALQPESMQKDPYKNFANAERVKVAAEDAKRLAIEAAAKDKDVAAAMRLLAGKKLIDIDVELIKEEEVK